MLSQNIISGFVTAIIMLASTASYSVLIFSGPLSGYLPVGLGAGFVSAGLIAIFFALFSQIPFAVSGPDSKPVAVLSTLAGVIAAGVAARDHGAGLGPTALVAVVIGTVLVGVALALFGQMRIGRWIRYVPYPVIGGFLAASGWLLLSGSVRVMTGTRLTWMSFGTLYHSGHLGQLAAGLGFATAFSLLRRIKHPAALPVLLLGGVLVVHLALALAGISVAEARRQGWLLDIVAGASWPNPWLSGDWRIVDWGSILRGGGEYVALIAVTAITLLLSTTAVEVEARLDVDVDHELKINGYANLIAALFGGMVGTLSVSRTMFNYKSGSRGRMGGIVAGVICLFPLLFQTKALGYFPVPLLGGMLFQIGASMLYEWLAQGWRRMERMDYLQVVVIMLVIVYWDFVAGVAVGVVAACITFAVNAGRIHLVKSRLTRSSYASRVDRSPLQHMELLRHGNRIQIMWLHGLIFFGSANNLYNHIKEIIAAQGPGGCSMIVLDFQRVLGMDSSSVMSFMKLRHLAEREKILIAVSSLPAAVERALRQSDFLGGSDDTVCMAFADIDAALEWCEEKLLSETLSLEEALRSADQWLSREIGGQETFNRFVSYLELIEFQPNELLFQQGDDPDALYFIYAGRVSVLFRSPDGGVHRLRSMVGQTVIGEMGIYRSLKRGASVEANKATIVYKLSIEAMTQMEEDDPQLAHAVHRFIIRTLAARLDFANHQVASLAH
jgi:SulP family sulfate permease